MFCSKCGKELNNTSKFCSACGSPITPIVMGNRVNNPEQIAKDALEEYVKNWVIFVDTCSILHDSANKFWNNIIPFLRYYNKKVIVTLRVCDELEKHSKNVSDIQLANSANEAKKIVKQLEQAGFIEIRGEQNDNFADNVFQVVFTKFRMSHKLLLITQDNNLAQDILLLNDSKSVKANPVNVKRINKYGFLSDFGWNSDSKDKNSNVPTYKNTNTVSNALPDECFRIRTNVTRISANPIRVSHIPGESEQVYTNNGKIELLNLLGSGGEACVYTTNTPYVAKIYKEGKITERKQEKIKLMLSKKISCSGICYPVEIIYNLNREFVGYLMPPAKGYELQKSVFGPKPLFLKKFPGWKKRDTVQLCLTILKKIKYLHDRNIILGDINPANILVVSPTEVYFVDTDSYQIEDFPCPVGTVNFTAPEIQGKQYKDFLRTKGHENFAIATLLFMIMLPGKPPYSQQGGEDPMSNIRKMDFSYPFGENSNKKTPEGPWRYIWSHLTYKIKDAFYNTFRYDGSHAKEADRLSVDVWIDLFEDYLNLIESGKYAKQDPMSEELFPSRLKKNSNATYVKCHMCGQETDESFVKMGLCRSCMDKGDVIRCKKCGKEFIYTNYQRLVKKMDRPETCLDCHESSKAVKMRQTCVDCGSVFDITSGEYDFMRSKGLDIPKRCKNCRGLNSYNWNTNKPYSQPQSTYHKPKPQSNNTTKSSGFWHEIVEIVKVFFG